MDMQKLINTVSEVGRRDRSRYHLTLGKLLVFLETVPPDARVVFDHGNFPNEAHSYRGYYSDLAFESSLHIQTVNTFSQDCRVALNKCFEGYKGGDFIMKEDTPLWNASYGSCGRAIMEAIFDHSIYAVILKTKQVD